MKLNRILPLLVLAIGCTNELAQPPEHPTTAPTKTLAEAVTSVIESGAAIRNGFVTGDVDAAHGPLHEIGYELEELPAVIKESDLSEDDQKMATDAADQLMTAFGNIDSTLHGNEGSTYDEEAQAIDTAIKTLASLANIEVPTVDTPATQNDTTTGKH